VAQRGIILRGYRRVPERGPLTVAVLLGVNIACPLCLSPSVRVVPVAAAVFVCACDPCQTIFTIQCEALKNAPFEPDDSAEPDDGGLRTVRPKHANSDRP
jgi:hypothetical protein